MSIKLYVSNSLTKLSNQLSTDLKNNKIGVFDQEQIVTQTEGMNNWLKIKIANELGITANCIFNKPNDVVTKIYYLLAGKSKPLIGGEYIKWKIYHLLGQRNFINKFPDIANYYTVNEIKQIALATKMADLFDQYQMYRPDTIESWNKITIDEFQDDWQQWLWVSIKSQVKDTMLDKTGMIQFIIHALKEKSNQQLLNKKILYLHFFGIAVITPFYLQLFNELSKSIEIRFYLLNPAPSCYWMEDETEKAIARKFQKAKIKSNLDQYANIGNTLLNSWGGIVKESFSLLFQDEQYINLYNDDLAEEPGKPNTLLKKIQQDIFLNSPSSDRNEISVLEFSDESLVINSCFTAVREVECLYNYLVYLVDVKKEILSTRDIVVMVTDIDQYAPFIRAIFDNAPYRFPYTIADESISASYSLFKDIELILSLQFESFKAEEVIELLNSKYIQERFSLTDIETIRKSVDAANIRFGKSGSDDNDTRFVSWEYGLQRIMYGICISGEPIIETYAGESLIPIDIIEGASSLELIKFWHFMQMLQGFLEERNMPRSIADWIAYIQELVENLLFQAGEKEDEDYHSLINYLDRIADFQDISDEPIGFNTFKYSFLELLQSDKKKNAFSGGGVTFCSLIPMRSIPFKVVAMLGMGFDSFPRKESKLSFSLLDGEKRKGDRNIKNNDKHLFLETILSAQNYLYISYQGLSTKDATTIPPSSLVDELINYIIQGTDSGDLKLRNKIITEHPLHGFSQRYFNNSGLYSYLSNTKYKSQDLGQSDQREPITYQFDEILLSDLQRFFKEPFKWYFNKALGIYYNDKEVLLPDTELFELNHLQNWQIEQDLIEMDVSDYELYYDKLCKTGKLPLKNIGRIVFEQLVLKIDVKKEWLNDIIRGKLATSVDVNLQINNSIITGKVNNVYENQFIIACDSGRITKHLVAAYITYLVLTAQGEELDFLFLLTKSTEIKSFPAGSISQQISIDRLTELIDKFKIGYTEPFYFCPSLSSNPYELFETDGSNFEMMVKDLYNNNEYSHNFDDQYMQKAYENGFFLADKFDDFKDNSLNIFDQINDLIPNIIK